MKPVTGFYRAALISVTLHYVLTGKKSTNLRFCFQENHPEKHLYSTRLKN